MTQMTLNVMWLMSQPLRIEIEDVLCHVTAPGWKRRVIVGDDRDRQGRFRLLDWVVVRHLHDR